MVQVEQGQALDLEDWSLHFCFKWMSQDRCHVVCLKGTDFIFPLLQLTTASAPWRAVHAAPQITAASAPRRAVHAAPQLTAASAPWRAVHVAPVLLSTPRPAISSLWLSLTHCTLPVWNIEVRGPTRTPTELELKSISSAFLHWDRNSLAELWHT